MQRRHSVCLSDIPPEPYPCETSYEGPGEDHGKQATLSVFAARSVSTPDIPLPSSRTGTVAPESAVPASDYQQSKTASRKKKKSRKKKEKSISYGQGETTASTNGHANGHANDNEDGLQRFLKSQSVRRRVPSNNSSAGAGYVSSEATTDHTVRVSSIPSDRAQDIRHVPAGLNGHGHRNIAVCPEHGRVLCQFSPGCCVHRAVDCEYCPLPRSCCCVHHSGDCCYCVFQGSSSQRPVGSSVNTSSGTSGGTYVGTSVDTSVQGSVQGSVHGSVQETSAQGGPVQAEVYKPESYINHIDTQAQAEAEAHYQAQAQAHYQAQLQTHYQAQLQAQYQPQVYQARYQAPGHTQGQSHGQPIGQFNGQAHYPVQEQTHYQPQHLADGHAQGQSHSQAIGQLNGQAHYPVQEQTHYQPQYFAEGHAQVHSQGQAEDQAQNDGHYQIQHLAEDHTRHHAQNLNLAEGHTHGQTKDQAQDGGHFQAQNQVQNPTEDHGHDQVESHAQDQAQNQSQDEGHYQAHQAQNLPEYHAQTQVQSEAQSLAADHAQSYVQDHAEGYVQNEVQGQTEDQTQGQAHGQAQDQAKDQVDDQAEGQAQDDDQAQHPVQNLAEDCIRGHAQGQTENQSQSQAKDQTEGQNHAQNHDQNEVQGQSQHQAQNLADDHAQGQVEGQAEDQTKDHAQDDTQNHANHAQDQAEGLSQGQAKDQTQTKDEVQNHANHAGDQAEAQGQGQTQNHAHGQTQDKAQSQAQGQSQGQDQDQGQDENQAQASSRALTAYTLKLLETSTYSDCRLIIKMPMNNLHPIPFPTHKVLLSRAPRLATLLNANKDTSDIDATTGDTFSMIKAFETALQNLYGLPYLTPGTLKAATAEALGYEGVVDELEALLPVAFPIRAAMADYTLCYIASGAFLGDTGVVETGMRLAIHIAHSDNLELLLSFALRPGRLLFRSPAATVTPEAATAAAAKDVSLDRHLATLIRIALGRLFEPLGSSFELYISAQPSRTVSFPDRIPASLRAYPGSILENPKLAEVKFGSFASVAELRPRPEVERASGVLLALSFDALKIAFGVLDERGLLTEEVATAVVIEREARRFYALRVYAMFKTRCDKEGKQFGKKRVKKLKRENGIKDEEIRTLGYRESIVMEEEKKFALAKEWVGLEAP